MQVSEIVEELNLKTYEYNKKENSFVHFENSDKKNFSIYDFTSEIIKLVRFLNINHIDFEEDFKGNIKLI